MHDKNNIVRMNEKLVKNEKPENTIITKILQISVNICTFLKNIIHIQRDSSRYFPFGIIIFGILS